MIQVISYILFLDMDPIDPCESVEDVFTFNTELGRNKKLYANWVSVKSL